MALIKCPECEKDVSDKAPSCPNCGCPIEKYAQSGTVQIKMGIVNGILNGNQTVTVHDWFSGGPVLWEGKVGEVAQIYLKRATTIAVVYHVSPMHWGGQWEGKIDPAQGKKYSVTAKQGVLSTKLVLSPVDVFDSE